MKALIGITTVALLIASAAFAQTAKEITVKSMPPSVIKTVPQAGDTDVDPALKEITVTFSKDMKTNRMWAVCQISKETFPENAGQIHYLSDQRIEQFMVSRQSNSGKPASAPVESKEGVKPEAQKPVAKKVSGRVTDEAGKPLPRARWQISAREVWQDGKWVRLHHSGDEPEFYTDNEGRFELPVSDDVRYDVQFDQGERGPVFLFQVGSGRRELHVVMKPGVPVHATVIRADTQEPVREQTRVSLALPNPRGLWYRKTQQVDHQGQVHFYASPAPTLPDSETANSPRWQIECAGQAIPIDVRDGEPVNVRVKVAASADNSEFSSQQSAAKNERAAELKFLSDVPEFREFNLKLTEEKLKALVNQHHLLANVFRDEDGERSYRVFRTDGENVIIEFRGWECAGVQRMRRDVEGLAKSRAAGQRLYK